MFPQRARTSGASNPDHFTYVEMVFIKVTEVHSVVVFGLCLVSRETHHAHQREGGDGRGELLEHNASPFLLRFLFQRPERFGISAPAWSK